MLDAELWAILEGVKLARETKVQNFSIESNSLGAVKLVSSLLEIPT